MTLLAETVHQLTRTHKVQVPGTQHPAQYADALPLLEQLRMLIRGTGHGGQEIGGAGGGSKPPINLRALDLWTEITTTVNQGWPGAGRPVTQSVPLGFKLRAWAEQDPENVRLTDQCLAWAEQITRAIHPVKRIDIMGTCPSCQCTHVMNTDPETGEHTYNHALTAYTEPAHVACAVCGTTWEGQAIHHLRGLVRGPAETASAG
ncbi:hypothetical protein [uncultured Kocuria sp.]|uniref:DUF7341 domain-containing protein n=1 Tax=uncultured Kocuria sp. TaxID=259305 RepID=UPI0025FA8434|nr:hypothetical protein [uncultured Kocuria sp.]